MYTELEAQTLDRRLKTGLLVANVVLSVCAGASTAAAVLIGFIVS